MTNSRPSPQNALNDLYQLMRDQSISTRARIDAAVSASRVEPATQPHEQPPPAVQFLRNAITFRHNGKPYQAELRRKAGSALAFWERRAAVAAMKFSVADNTEITNAWRRTLNGLIRHHLWKDGRWPADKHLLIDPDDSSFDRPPHDPKLALDAILVPGQRQHAKRKAFDQPDQPHITSEEQREQILADLAKSLQTHLEKGT